MVVVGMKGTFPVKHLVEDAPHSINVTFEVDLSSSLEPFWGKVQGRS